MLFRAKVINTSTEVETIDIDASDETEARHFVASAGHRLLDLRAVGLALPAGPRRYKFNLRVFNQQLHSLLAAGQPVADSIDILGRNDKAGRHAAIYRSLLQSLRQGKQFSAAMAALPAVFPALYVAMVRASETTGSVRVSIGRFMKYQRQVDDIRGKLVAAAIYPAILLLVGGIVIAFLMLYVVPRFSVVFDDAGGRHGDTAGFIVAWGGFVRTHGELAWSGLFLAIGALTLPFTHPAPKGWCQRQILRLPWIGERIWVLQLGRLYRTLSMLLRSGVSVLAAMRMTEASLPLAMQAALRTATQSISEGRPLSAVLGECGLSTEVSQRLLLAGESSGNLDEMMEHIADFYDQEVAGWIDTASRLLEPVLMVGIGLVIGAVVLMLYTPIFELANVP